MWPPWLRVLSENRARVEPVPRARERVKGIVEPVLQIPVGEEVQTQQGHQSAERPREAGVELRLFEDEDGEQRGPLLHLERVLTGAREDVDAQVLFDRLEEELNLPAIFVDSSDRGGAEVQVIRQHLDLAFVDRIQTTTRRSNTGQRFLPVVPVKRIS